MPQTESFEILILGAGSGGTLLSWDMAASGRRTASKFVNASVRW
jgi:hypothetical protein